ncbi:hypothetical protein RhiJN_04279 [Ceratobasidium sp. AG-Ba]|nr:hypothetical protein RhiJN_04279 [Ceratobasidium sp. AG-Ba]QRW05169.1 hypothetical protein RhiLY_04168 [Ceratobasidium sp. AG-Ba]
MNRGEDTQPSESTHGRPKRILPFVKDTSRGRGGKGRGVGSANRGGRGQPRGFGPNSGTPFSSGTSRAAPHRATGSNSIPISSASQTTGSPQEIFHSATESAFQKSASSKPAISSHIPTHPRRKFVPKIQTQSRERNLSNSASGTSGSSLCPQLGSDLAIPASKAPPAKRPRFDKSLSVEPSTTSMAEHDISNIKFERNDVSTTSNQAEPATGSRFISFGQYSRCSFGCGLNRNQVLNNRNSVREEVVADLRKQGLNVVAVYMRDDGIAIDWSLTSHTPGSQPIPGTTTSAPQGEQDSACEENVSFASLMEQPFNTPPPDYLPTHSPPSNVAYILSFQDSVTQGSTESAYRDIPIPMPLFSAPGKARELENWVVEQMNQLETELGSVLIAPPELVGIDEHLTVQHTTSNTKPYLRIKYKHLASMMPLEPTECGGPLTSILDPNEPPGVDPVIRDSLRSSTFPPIAYLPQPSSPISHDNEPLLFKSEKDRLALDPPSPCPIPEVAPLGTSYTNPTVVHPDTNNLDRQSSSFENGRTACSSVNSDMDEIQRLREDLETSRLEAEQKHKELERRILELTNQRAGPATPEVGVVSGATLPTSQVVRVVDAYKSSVIPLHKGKHDETRCLLSLSHSTALHVSWLGAMQLIDHDRKKVVASGFEEGAPDGVSTEDACLLSESSIALALAGNGCQLGIVTIGKKSFGYRPLPERPHDPKGICAVAPVDAGQAITLGYDRCYFHWRLDHDNCLSNLLPIPKLHECTALVYEPLASNIITAGSDYRKRGRMGVYSLGDSRAMPTTVDLSNHVHRIHNDVENPSLIILEVI